MYMSRALRSEVLLLPERHDSLRGHGEVQGPIHHLAYGKWQKQYHLLPKKTPT